MISQCSYKETLSYFRFATLDESGLLLYNGRYNELHDFIALEIVDGGQSVQFSFSLGSDVTKVSATIPGGVNDGNWHTVIVSYYNKVSTFSKYVRKINEFILIRIFFTDGYHFFG